MLLFSACFWNGGGGECGFGVWCDVSCVQWSILVMAVWILSVVFLIGLFLNFWGFIMNNIFSRMMAVGLVMWLGLSAGVANAGVPTMSAWDGSALAGYNATIGNSGVTSPFTDVYSFSIPFDVPGNGSANAIKLTAANVMFTAFTLAEASFGTIVGIISGSEANLTFAGGATPGAYTLTVAGYKVSPLQSGSYAGNVSINAVPEPETYAMLLAGLGLVGFTARRRKNSAA